MVTGYEQKQLEYGIIHMTTLLVLLMGSFGVVRLLFAAFSLHTSI